MTKKKKSNLNYKNIEHRKKNYHLINKQDRYIKEAISTISNIRTNFYQKIYMLINTHVETWRQFEFLSSNHKIEDFIEKINNEIEKIKNNKLNITKYKVAILSILGLNENNIFNDDIIKNMYVAKLQNIIFILKTPDDEGKNQEVNENKTISM